MTEAPATATKASTILASIQALRAVAAWMVVGAHYSNTFAPAKPNWLQTGFINHGAEGVDIFFVISGFVMALTASSVGITPRQFAARRLARIVPAYWFYTLVCAVMITQMPTVMWNWGYSHELLVKSLLFVPAANPDVGGYFPVLTVGWTLNLEMVFYLVVAISLLSRGSQRWLWIAGAIAALQVLSGTVGLVSPAYHDSVMYEFLMGLVAAHLWKAGILRGPAWRFIVLAIVAIAGLVLGQSSLSSRGLDFGVPAFLLVCACLGLEPYFKRATVLVHLGNHSYSVYLVHTLVFSVAIFIHHQHRGHVVLISVCSFAAIALLGAASYQFLERPAGRLMLRWLMPRRRPDSLPAASTSSAA